MKKSTNKSPTKLTWHLVLVLVLVLQTAAIFYLAYSLKQASKFNETTDVGQAQSIGTLRNATNQSRVTMSMTETSVYIPEMRIKLHLNDNTALMTYSLRNEPGMKAANNEADISTMALATYQPLTEQAIGCTSAVRVKLEATPNPYNPHEQVVASVKLQDGRTLQAYAFTHKDCLIAFEHSNIDSVEMGKEFLTAEAY